MNTCLFGSTLEDLQPLVFLWDDVFIKTRESKGQAKLVSASRVEHTLGRFCSISNLVEHHRRVTRHHFIRRFQQELEKKRMVRCTEPLSYFVQYLVPSVTRGVLDIADEFPVRDSESAIPVGSPSRIDSVVDDAPLPAPPTPSLWLFGRFWYLDGIGSITGRMHVRIGKRSLGLTGDFSFVSTLQKEWHRKVDAYFEKSAVSLIEEMNEREIPDSLTAARQELSQRGWLQSGDLLYINGNPPRLGHVVPPHYNHTLRRQSDRDLAVTASLEWPRALKRADLRIYERNPGRGGEWRPASIPHGLCLGHEPESALPNTNWHSIAAYLRWAAVRIAGNGRFHAGD